MHSQVLKHVPAAPAVTIPKPPTTNREEEEESDDSGSETVPTPTGLRDEQPPKAGTEGPMAAVPDRPPVEERLTAPEAETTSKVENREKTDVERVTSTKEKHSTLGMWDYSV